MCNRCFIWNLKHGYRSFETTVWSIDMNSLSLPISAAHIFASLIDWYCVSARACMCDKFADRTQPIIDSFVKCHEDECMRLVRDGAYWYMGEIRRKPHPSEECGEGGSAGYTQRWSMTHATRIRSRIYDPQYNHGGILLCTHQQSYTLWLYNIWGVMSHILCANMRICAVIYFYVHIAQFIYNFIHQLWYREKK